MMRVVLACTKSSIGNRGNLMQFEKSVKAALAITAALMAEMLAAPVSAGQTPNTVIATIPVGPLAIGVAVDPARGTTYVTNANYFNGGNDVGDSVYVVDNATNTVTTTVPVGRYPYAIAADPIHWTVYVTNYLDWTVSAIDERTNTVIATIPVGAAPHGLGLDPFRGTVYVANDASRTVSVIDEATNVVTDTIAVPNNLNTLGVAVDPVRGLVYVTADSVGFTASYLLVIDENTNQIVKTITLPVTSFATPLWNAVDPVRGIAYVAASPAVAVVDERNESVEHAVSIGGAFGIGVDLVSGTIYATSNGTVVVIDPFKGVVTHTVASVPGATGIGVDPIRGLVYVADSNDGGPANLNTVTVIATGHPTPCQDLRDFPLLPLLCPTSLLNPEGFPREFP
jgi:YVTN family beta-propeller protein